MRIKKFLFLVSLSATLSLFAIDLFAQNTWRVLSKTDNVELSYKIENCNGKQKLLLQLKNGNQETKQMQWSIRYKVNGSEWIEIPATKSLFTISGQKTAEGQCSETRTFENLGFWVQSGERFEIEVVKFGQIEKN